MLQSFQLLLGQRVSFSNYWYDVYFVLKFSHCLNVNRSQTSHMRRYKVETTVNSRVRYLASLHTIARLVQIERIELTINIVLDRFPCLVRVERVAKARRVHYGQLEANAFLFQLARLSRYGDSLFYAAFFYETEILFLCLNIFHLFKQTGSFT